MNDSNSEKHVCHKCKLEINTKYHLSCIQCKIFYHVSCISNYTNQMKNELLLCNKCLIQYYNEESYSCDKCPFKCSRKIIY